MRKFIATVFAAAVLVAGVFSFAHSASAAPKSAPSVVAAAVGGNTVYNYGQNGDVAMQRADGVWFNYVSGGGGYMTNVKCVRPNVYMKSQWGGGYAAGQVRCFSTSGNVLKLYRI